MTARLALALGLALFQPPLHAADEPQPSLLPTDNLPSQEAGILPEKDSLPLPRTVSLDQIRNHWIQDLKSRPLPPKPQSSNPVLLRSWNKSLQSRRQLLSQLQSGKFDEQARLAQLHYNYRAWKKYGNDERANEIAALLHEIAAKKEQEAREQIADRQRQEAKRRKEAEARRLLELSREVEQLKRQNSALADQVHAQARQHRTVTPSYQPPRVLPAPVQSRTNSAQARVLALHDRTRTFARIHGIRPHGRDNRDREGRSRHH